MTEPIHGPESGDHGPLLSDRKAVHDALIAAVEAERADLERGEAHR